MSYQIVTANRLLDGRVVYFTAAHTWSEDVKKSVCVDTEGAGAEIIAQAQGSVESQDIVDPYLIDVEIDDSGVTPVAFRERIRSKGPTNEFGSPTIGEALNPSTHQKRAA